MYLEADDPCDVVSSSSNYYQDSDDYGAEYNAGLGGSYAELNGSYDAAPPSPGAKQRDRDAVPEFLKQERAVQAAIEAAKKKQEFMVYKNHPLFGKMRLGFTQPTGSWNQRFQALMDQEDSFEKFDLLRSTAHDFVHAAEAYGRIIISELCLPDELKTIKPTALGGVAGGQKFVVQDILFKFAVDFEGLYGGDEFAMKGAGHDLAGLMAYMSAIEMRPRELRLLHVPLMALIDFRGYRLVAICVLPIDRKTICYGSFDAGRTVHNTFLECNMAMKEIGQYLNIKGHRGANSEHLIYAPIDIEAHKGKDGKFYVLDFARYMPPQPPSGKWGGSLYELLRPELVKQSPVPLSPDAFSPMGHAEDMKEGRQSIRDLFAKLVVPEAGGIIFDYAQLIDSSEESQSEISERSVQLIDENATLAAQEVLVRELHSRGINMRFLGRLRSFCKSTNIRSFLLAECLARFWKCELRHLWRDVMRHEKTPSAEPFQKITSSYLNMLLRDQDYWRNLKQKLPEKFPSALSPEELAEDFSLQQVPFVIRSALLRLLVCLNIELEKTTLAELLKACADSVNTLQSFEFVSGDILNMNCRTKHMNMVDKADAYAYMYQAAAVAKKNPGTASRLLNLALGKLLTAMKTSGSDLELQFKFCLCRVELFKLTDQASYYTLAKEAISALTIKVELLGSAMLPNVMMLGARLELIKRKRHGNDVTLEFRFVALDLWQAALKSYKTHLGSFLAAGQPIDGLKTGLLPFLLKTAKAVEFVLQNPSSKEDYEKSLQEGLERRNVLVPLFNDFLELSRNEKFFAQRPEIGLWLWFLLYTHARSNASMVPEHVTRAMMSDSDAFLVRAVQIKPSLQARLLKIVSVTDVRSLAQYLPAANACTEIFEAFSKISSQWGKWDCSAIKLSPPLCFSRLCSFSSVSKLKLRTSEGLDNSSMAVLLGSEIRNSLKSLSLPASVHGGVYMLQLSESFPALERLSARRTMLKAPEAAHFVRLCPALFKIDFCQTLLSPEDLVDWVPSGLKKLDLGFPVCGWAPSSLIRLLDHLPKNLEFLGLAGTSICDEQFMTVLNVLPSLKYLDICKTYITERFARSVSESVSFPSSMKQIWMPFGYLCPFVGDDEVTISLSQYPHKLSLLHQGKTFFNLFKTSGGVRVSPSAQNNVRRVHLEVLGDIRNRADELEGTVYSIRARGNFDIRVSMTDNLEGSVLAGVVAPGSFNLNRNGPPTPLNTDVFFQGETFCARCMFGPNGKVSQLSIVRKSTNESRNFYFPPGQQRPPFYKVKSFPGVSPVVFFVIMQVLGANRPVAFDQLFL